MQVTEKGQVTIPKRIRDAAGVLPGTEVQFALKGSRIIITKLAATKPLDKREQLKAAAAKAPASMDPKFRQMSSDQMMAFLRG